jgi:hypothetical protein
VISALWLFNGGKKTAQNRHKLPLKSGYSIAIASLIPSFKHLRNLARRLIDLHEGQSNK